MYYLVIIVTMAASLAASDIVSEISSEYFAHYVIENDPADIGLKAPADKKTAQAPEAQSGAAASGATGAADLGKAEARATLGPVTQVLFAGLAAGTASSAIADGSGRPMASLDPDSGATGRAAVKPAIRPIRVASLTIPSDAAGDVVPLRAASLSQPAPPGPADEAAPPAPADGGAPAAAAPANVAPVSATPPATPADAVAPPAAPADAGPSATPAVANPPADAGPTEASPPPAAAAPASPTTSGDGGSADGQSKVILDLARDTPYRTPDGSAFLPIATQRLFSMRWLVSRRSAVPLAFEIPGHVITNPSTGTTVPATLAGVIEANQGTFPYLGMRVRAGDVLGYLRPTMTASERAQIQARIEQLANLISLTEKQIERLQEVLFVRYRVNKIEALKVQMDGNRRELAALQDSLERREVLRATSDGVISRIAAVVGGTVNQGESVFEIVDPRALWVEAAAYDPAIAADVKSATAETRDGHTLALEFVGGGLVLDNQAIPLRFRVVDPPQGLSVGTPVSVIVRQSRTVEGIPVPAGSVIRDGDGRSIVWERLSAETFMPRQVKAVRVAGNTMVVETGLSDGARVVVDGATILNQVR